ncbi:MAG: hypothetical protein ABI083_04460, partial [Lapillicoccus sp.]
LLYLGRPTDSVTVEAYRHLVDPVIDDPTIIANLAPRVLVTADVNVSEILDLRSPRTRVAVGLSLGQIQSTTDDRNAYAACHQDSAAAHQGGFPGLIAPAATGLGETLALLSNLLSAAEQPVVTDVMYWDQLPADPRAARPGARLRVVRDD